MEESISKQEKLAIYLDIKNDIEHLKDGLCTVFGGEDFCIGEVLVEAEEHDDGMKYLVDDYYMSHIPSITALVYRSLSKQMGF